MNFDQIASMYEEIFKERFPQVHVVKDPEVGDLDEGFLAVMCIKNDEIKAYYNFVYNELSDILEAKKIERIGLIPHTYSDLKKYYPQYYEKFCSNS